MRNRTALLVTMLMVQAHADAEQKADPGAVEIKVLSAGLANAAVVAAAQHCRSAGYQVAVAVVDRGGNLLAFLRDPLAGPHTVEVSRLKAYSAVTYQAPTSAMMRREELRYTPGLLLVGGGLPVEIGGSLYGAIGVSGAPAKKVTGDSDEECARAGIEAIRETLEFGG